MSRYQSTEPDDAKIDLTPMLDVVFIMLIFFIVTASFIREASITIDRPDKSPPTNIETKTKNLIVSVQADNQILLDKRHIDKRALRAYFERHKAQYPESILIIRAHNKSITNTIAQVADSAIAAGMDKVSLVNVAEL